MKKRKWNVRLGELSTLIYLLFPIISIFNEKRGSQTVYLIVLAIFIVSYLMLVIYYYRFNNNVIYSLLVVHYVGIIYFVYAINPMNSLFFFFSAFALPFMFEVTIKSIEFITFIIAIFLCLIITSIYQIQYITVLVIFYLVILIITLGNFKTKKDGALKNEIEEKNKYINTLIAEQERQRIGQDLHDTLGHVFVSLSLKSELAYKLIDKDQEKAKNEILAINQISKDTLIKVRNIIENLKSQSFEEEVQSIKNILKDANIQFELKNIRKVNVLTPTKQSILSMILREAINNVIKHAKASKIYCEMIQEDNNLYLIIQDNGKGCNTTEDFKLKSIENRVKLLKGKLEIKSKNGMHIRIMIPREDIK
ncbi:sensor histidine kinase [Staphylococcus hominis]|uniref:sensor histidine kinase n=1 Tax=Staphylococcus hominis TaxID=1290 RepID=UPI001A8D00A7|nr:sensor histidine kinase [Staphylococcus hominis]MBO0380242.1 sensor histidine kinase [Staphylococcus hominis]MDO0978233.1 sensor histidine kinase [Staphylococcus hominis]MEB5574860.1 sensor histidine kinase [Staphylococcus hominis]